MIFRHLFFATVFFLLVSLNVVALAQDADQSERTSKQVHTDSEENRVTSQNVDGTDADIVDVDELSQEDEDDLFTLDESLVEVESRPFVIQSDGLSQEDLAATSYSDAAEATQRVAGVYARTEDGFGLRPNLGFRGVNAERSKKISLFEDGVPFGPAPYSAPAAYYFPMMMRMTALDVEKGAATLFYGPQLVTGAVHLTSREIPDSLSSELTLAYGLYHTRKIHGYIGDSFSLDDGGRIGLLAEIAYVGTEGFKEIDDSDQSTGFDRGDLMFKGYWQSADDGSFRQRIDAKFTLSLERSNETYLGLTDADFEADPYRRYAASEKDKMRWWHTTATFHYEGEWRSGLKVRADLYRHDFRRSWLRYNRLGASAPSTADILASPRGRREVFYDVLRGAADSQDSSESIFLVDNDRQYVSQGAILGWSYDYDAFGLSHRSEFSLRLHHDSISRNHDEFEYLMRDAHLQRANSASISTADSDADSLVLSAIFAHTLRVGSFVLRPIVRLDQIQGSFDDHLSDSFRSGNATELTFGVESKLGIADGFEVFASFFRGYSPVSPQNIGEASSESSYDSQLGADFDFDWLKLRGVAFANYYQDMLSVCSFSSGCDPDKLDAQTNGGEALAAGGELTIGAREELWRDGSFSLDLNYAYTRAEFLNTFKSEDPIFGDVTEGDLLPYVPEHQMRFRIGYKHAMHHRYGLSSIDADVFGGYTASMLEEAGGTRETDDFITLDASLRFHFGEDAKEGEEKKPDWLTLYIRGENLLNTKPLVARRPFGARPGKPLLIETGLTLRI